MRWAPLLGLSLLLPSPGCGGSSNQPATQADMEQTALGDVAELYRLFQTTKNKPPTSVNDLVAFEQGAPTGLRAIRSGDVVVRYGATLPDTGEGFAAAGADEVLAYQKQVPESGGMVLMLNRSIKRMTADEFKAAKKAGKD